MFDEKKRISRIFNQSAETFINGGWSYLIAGTETIRKAETIVQ